MGRNTHLILFAFLLIGVEFCRGDGPKVEVKETKGEAANQFILDCVVTYKGQQVTSGVHWTDAEGKELSPNNHLTVTLKPGANVMRCKYDVDGWSGHRTLTRVLQTVSSSTSGERPTAEIKETKGDSENQYKLECIVTYKGKQVTSGITWVDANEKELSPNNHLDITVRPGANVVRCKYVVGGWSGHKTLTMIVQTGGTNGEKDEQPVAEIKETKGKGQFDLILECVVVHKGQKASSGVSWTDGAGKVLSPNSHLEITLKPGPNVMRCKYEVNGWSGHKTLNRILQIDDQSTINAKPVVEIDEQRGSAENEFILDCIVKSHGKRVHTGVSWVDADGNVLSTSHLLKVTLKVGENVVKCKYQVGVWSGTKTLTMVVQKEVSEADKPEVTINEKQGASGTQFSLDCVVMYKGGRVTDGVLWTDGKGTILSHNSHLEVTLKTGMNVMRCKYNVGGWTGHKTVVRILQVGGSTEGGSGSTSGSSTGSSSSGSSTGSSTSGSSIGGSSSGSSTGGSSSGSSTGGSSSGSSTGGSSSSGSTGGSDNGGRKTFVIMNTGDPETSYEEWQELCRHRGGELARIHDAAEQKLVEAVLVKMNIKNVLIDGQRMGGRGDTPIAWVFADGTEMTFTNWNKGEPNNANRNEKCIQMYGVGEKLGKWNDVPCKLEAALCLVTKNGASGSETKPSKPETKPAPKPETKPAPKPEPKPETKPAPKPEPKPETKPAPKPEPKPETKPSKGGSEVSYGILPVPDTPTKKYIMISAGKKVTVTTLEEKCKANGGRLASIDNEAEQKLLMSALKNSKARTILIGIKRDPKNLKQFINADGKPISYTNWAPREPNHQSEGCVEVYKLTGKWNDVDCKGTIDTALCEIRQASVSVAFAPQPLPKSFVLISGSQLPYESWEIKCRSHGGHLAKIQNAADQQMAEAVLMRVRTHSVLISGKRSKGGDFAFPDGSKLTYTNWNSGEPNDKGKHESCIELYRSNGKWNDISCNQRGAALCEVPDSGAPAPLYAKAFILIDNKKVLKLEEWKKQCVDHGGKLASIDNAVEQREVEAVLRKQKTEARTALIAIHRDHKQPKRFLTGAGRPLVFSNWNKGEPNYVTEKCAEVYTTDKVGKWNDIACQGKAALCEISKFQPLPVSVKHFGILEAKEKIHISAWKAQCEAQGGRLATMSSAAEAHTAEAALQMAKKRAVLIGVFRSLEDSSKFVTLDGKTVTYTNWGRGEPNNVKERCVEVFSGEGRRGKWNDFQCMGDAAMCEFGQSDIIFAMAPRTKTFWVVQDKKFHSFEHWQKECGKKGGALARLESASDLEDAKPALRKANLYSLLVDGKRSAGHFLYSNGDRFTYKHWSKGEPNNDGGKENCLEIYGSGDKIGLFNDIPCKHVIALCQK